MRGVAHARRDAQPRAEPPCPYVGDSAFATKAGIHASAILKDPETYEHVVPEAVGNHRRCWSPTRRAGSNVIAELDRSASPSTRAIRSWTRLLDEIKEREAAGYAYEAADASFELLARGTLGKVPDYFEVEQFDVNVEQRYNANGQRVTVAIAVVKVEVGRRAADLGRPKATARSTRSTSRCARTSASTRNTSTA